MSKKVLIVDDDNTNVKYLSTVLTENGYQPIAAFDGAEGLQAAADHKPDLIVLDVMMPKRSGFRVFLSLKEADELKNIPVIMLTSIDQVIKDGKHKSEDETFEVMKDYYLEKMEKMVDNYRETGAVKPELFIDKPIDPDAFVKAVKSLIGG